MDISKVKLSNLKQWYLENGLVPRKKKSGGRQKTALSFEDIQQVVRFIHNFSDMNSIKLPGRMPGFKDTDVRVIPSNETKASIWRQYKDSLLPTQRVIQLSTFRLLWQQLMPYIVIAKPQSDLCWICQKNNNLIVRSVNVPEDEKSFFLKTQEQHLLRATGERQHYRHVCTLSRQVAEKHGLGDFRHSSPNSLAEPFHYSFDFAQQVLYPANPMQPGPIYFKVPRRCQVFGIHAEGLGKQMNYLIDESVSCGKGANVVISMLHHFLENFGMGEEHLMLNADNCAGQNKNSYLLWYLCWRVMNGVHKSASVAFMMAGHTKFAPDWCFGLFKRLYRRSFVSSLADIEKVVKTSTNSGINQCTLVGNENGKVFVPTFDWVTFLQPFFKKVVGISANHHFHISHTNPGVITMKMFCDSEEISQVILLKECPKNMPPEIHPKGLTTARKLYLFQHIREFCRDDTVNVVCPDPGIGSESEQCNLQTEGQTQKKDRISVTSLKQNAYEHDWRMRADEDVENDVNDQNCPSETRTRGRCRVVDKVKNMYEEKDVCEVEAQIGEGRMVTNFSRTIKCYTNIVYKSTWKKSC